MTVDRKNNNIFNILYIILDKLKKEIKMKKTHAFLTALLVMAVLFASCSHGSRSGDSDGSAKTQAVKVSLSLSGEAANVAQKVVGLNKPADGYTYWVKATPNWTGTNIQNPISSWTKIGYTGEAYELGYFTPGSWTFEAHIMAGNAQADSYNAAKVVYGGSDAAVYISTSTKAVTINTSLFNGAGAVGGTVNLKIAVPKANANAPDVTVTYGNVETATIDAEPTPNTTVDTDGVTGTSTNWYYFEKTVNVAAGTYVFAFDYLDEEDGNRIGGATVAFTVRNGETYSICGTIEEGQYQLATIIINMPSVSVTLAGNDSAAYAAEGSVSIIATPSAGATLAWYVNGALQPGDGTTFLLPRQTRGRFEVVCKATKNDLIGYASKIVTITP